jgi:predicted lipoprotein with Yx(FWY)xxD motif
MILATASEVAAGRCGGKAVKWEDEMKHVAKFPNVVLSAATVLLSLAFIGAGLAAEENYGPFKPVKTSAGTVLADAKGMTVYTYDKDTKGMSSCYGECAEYWPPVKATAEDKAVGDLTIIKRTDGTLQWTDGGKPLYTFVNDKKPGDVTGNNKNNVWHVVKED